MLKNVEGIRLYGLDNLKFKTSRSVKLEEREVAGIYDTRPPQLETIVRLTTEHDDENLSPVEIEQLADEPMEVDEDPANFEEDLLVFHPETTFSRRFREPALLLEDEKYKDEAHQSEWSDGPPSSKRARIDDDGLLDEAVLAYAAYFDGIPDTPNTYAEAIASGKADDWSKAVDAELHSHAQNHTWTLVPRKTNIRSIGCRRVLAKKLDESGQVVRYKARLVAQGFKQNFGVNFFATYSPVANVNSIRVALAVCAAHAYKMKQLDADTAFLNSTLVKTVYMEAPCGAKNAKGMICKLNKAIYGMKQAASAWNKTIRHVFLLNDFKSCRIDQCVYVKRARDGFVYVRLYVDDMIIAAKTSVEIQEVEKALKNAIRMKELGATKFILGMEFNHDINAGALMIRQTRYIDDVVKRFNQQNAKMVEKPCTSILKLSKLLSPTTEEGRAEMR
uniref:Reverse transcriptase Ty1/copia-type domain-containing protein n=1 Tax=Peronospora matthiolae TaxID=2874970 RepID=A0AAV1UWP6_9STRA